MSMKKFLVKKDYETTGCLLFHNDMEKWQKSPITVESNFVRQYDSIPFGRWTIRTVDLIPYTVQLENK